MKNTQILQRHPYHLVDPSPWPLLAAFGALFMTMGGVMYMHNYGGGGLFLTTGFLLVLFNMYTWWRDIVREAAFEGQHTHMVQIGMRGGMLLFIVSEVMFFFSFFWAFFHFGLAPAPEVNIWPPRGIQSFDFTCLPLINTLLLILSGSAITYAHHAILTNPVSRKVILMIILCVVTCAVLFTFLQAQEYFQSPYEFSDSNFGSIFFLATGFHGIHVLLGTFLIVYNMLRFASRNNFSNEHHFGLETAIWYWHFVDIVWLFLFAFVYCWGC